MIASSPLPGDIPSLRRETGLRSHTASPKQKPQRAIVCGRSRLRIGIGQKTGLRSSPAAPEQKTPRPSLAVAPAFGSILGRKRGCATIPHSRGRSRNFTRKIARKSVRRAPVGHGGKRDFTHSKKRPRRRRKAAPDSDFLPRNRKKRLSEQNFQPLRDPYLSIRNRSRPTPDSDRRQSERVFVLTVLPSAKATGGLLAAASSCRTTTVRMQKNHSF